MPRVVFENATRGRGWECPWGLFDGAPKHSTVADAAAEECWEETCGMIHISPDALRTYGLRGPDNGTHPFHCGVFALRVDGMSRQWFSANRKALQRLRREMPRGYGLASALEMKQMTFVPLELLGEQLGHAKRGAVEVQDVDGIRVTLSLLAKQLQSGGLQLAWDAFNAGDVPGVVVHSPERYFQKPGQTCTLDGVRTIVVQDSPPAAPEAASDHFVHAAQAEHEAHQREACMNSCSSS